jgi:hypothetical protein
MQGDEDYEVIALASQPLMRSSTSSSCDDARDDDLSSLTEFTDDDHASGNESAKSQQTRGYRKRPEGSRLTDQHDSSSDWEDEAVSAQGESNITLKMPNVHGSRDLDATPEEYPTAIADSEVSSNAVSPSVHAPAQGESPTGARKARTTSGLFDGSFEKLSPYLIVSMLFLLAWQVLLTTFEKTIGIKAGVYPPWAGSHWPASFGTASRKTMSIIFDTSALDYSQVVIVMPLHIRLRNDPRKLEASIERLGYSMSPKYSLTPLVDNLYSLNWRRDENWGTLLITARYNLDSPTSWQENMINVTFSGDKPFHSVEHLLHDFKEGVQHVVHELEPMSHKIAENIKEGAGHLREETTKGLDQLQQHTLKGFTHLQGTTNRSLHLLHDQVDKAMHLVRNHVPPFSQVQRTFKDIVDKLHVQDLPRKSVEKLARVQSEAEKLWSKTQNITAGTLKRANFGTHRVRSAAQDAHKKTTSASKSFYRLLKTSPRRWKKEHKKRQAVETLRQLRYVLQQRSEVDLKGVRHRPVDENKR